MSFNGHPISGRSVPDVSHATSDSHTRYPWPDAPPAHVNTPFCHPPT
jgi:hypothetical protein